MKVLLLVVLAVKARVPEMGTRLMEFYHDPAILTSMDPITREKYLAQEAIDVSNAQYSLNLNEGLPDSVPSRIGRVGLNMASKTHLHGSNLVVFLSTSHARHYVKFVHNCKTESLVATPIVPHPLLKEFWFGQVASQAGLSPRYPYISPPLAMAEGLFPSLTMEQLVQCQVAGASVRYIVAQIPAGSSLRDHLASQPMQRYSPVFAFTVGARLVRMVRELHAVGIAHGNLRLEDVYISMSPDKRSFALSFNHFGTTRTSWIDRETGLSLSRTIP